MPELSRLPASSNDINGIILQIAKGDCDNLFYIDTDIYFALILNYT